ncbi:hypothetical protein C7T94_04065 [Pedobacter yulinensis]|uniref:Uncharacterized protein n=1 Tax=Pedobacter yulinensis TaxID=2126353 RepID=A0A2T3HNE3_9SPHI|nr:hypothetical protein C7T94_04065 [Pedobacter yulinensis]
MQPDNDFPGMLPERPPENLPAHAFMLRCRCLQAAAGNGILFCGKIISQLQRFGFLCVLN